MEELSTYESTLRLLSCSSNTTTIHRAISMSYGADWDRGLASGLGNTSFLDDGPEDALPDPTAYDQNALLRELIWYYINGVGGTLISLVGLFGNTTAAIVLLFPVMRNSTSLLLVVMAVLDNVFLALHCLLQSLPLVFMANNVCEDYLWVREALFKYCYGLVHVAHTGTIYMAVLVTLERAMVVLLPLKAKNICTNSRAGLASAAVILWSIIYNVPRYLEYTEEEDTLMAFTDHSVTRTEFGRSFFFQVVYLVYFNSVVHFIVPVGLIIVLNLKMIQRVCTRGRRVVRLGRSRGESQTRLTAMIIALTGIFCLCQLLAALELILYPDDPVGQPQGDRAACTMTCAVVSALGETCTLLNSATNFLVYSIFGNKFRRCLRHLCCYCCRRKPRRHSVHGGTSLTPLVPHRHQRRVHKLGGGSSGGSGRGSTGDSVKDTCTRVVESASEETKVTDNSDLSSTV